MCLVARPLYGAQLWSKPLPEGKVAILVVNIGEVAQAFSLPLSDVPALDCGGSGGASSSSGGCAVRDVWGQKDLPRVVAHLPMQLRSHESAFFIINPN